MMKIDCLRGTLAVQGKNEKMFTMTQTENSQKTNNRCNCKQNAKFGVRLNRNREAIQQILLDDLGVRKNVLKNEDLYLV